MDNHIRGEKENIKNMNIYILYIIYTCIINHLHTPEDSRHALESS